MTSTRVRGQVPVIEGLRLEKWQGSPNFVRLGALQDLENALASQEGRAPCEVGLIPGSSYTTPADHASLRGYHKGQSIFINDESIGSETPYLATETLFHESRHAFQEHVAANPELAENPQQFEDLRMSAAGGYLSPDVHGYAAYRWQPSEKDANEVARQRTEALYGSEFEDSGLYAQHRAQMASELADDRLMGEAQLGAQYAEEARQRMISEFHQSQSLDLQHQKVDGLTTPSKTTALSPSLSGGAESQATQEDTARTAAEAAGTATGGPAGHQAGKAAGETAAHVHSAATESVGQSSEPPTNEAENAANEGPVADIKPAEKGHDHGYAQ